MELVLESESHNTPLGYVMPTHESKNLLVHSKGNLRITWPTEFSSGLLPLRSNPKLVLKHCSYVEDNNTEQVSPKKSVEFALRKCNSSHDVTGKKVNYFKFLVKTCTGIYMEEALKDPSIRQAYIGHAKDFAMYSSTEAYKGMVCDAEKGRTALAKDLLKFSGMLYLFLAILYHSCTKGKKTVIIGLEDVLLHMSLEKIKDCDLVIEPQHQTFTFGKVSSRFFVLLLHDQPPCKRFM